MKLAILGCKITTTDQLNSTLQDKRVFYSLSIKIIRRCKISLFRPDIVPIILLTKLYKIYTIYIVIGEFTVATKTLNIALDEKLLKDIDKAVKKDMGTRSEYFRRLALADLARRNRWEQLFASGKAVGKQMGIKSEEEVYKILND
jgi:hypothetical protein